MTEVPSDGEIYAARSFPEGPEFRRGFIEGMSRHSLDYLQNWRDRWGLETFGPDFFTKEEFAFRFLEEANELAQAMGLTREEAQRQTNVVYGRPVGSVPEEIAGTLVCLLALASSQNISVSTVVTAELARIDTPEMRAKILARQPEKRAAGLTRTSPTGRTDLGPCDCGDYKNSTNASHNNLGPPIWRPDGTCSWCGGLSPVYVLERLENQTARVSPTTKLYKGYLQALPNTSPVPGPTGKFYTYHFTVDEIRRLNETIHALSSSTRDIP